MSFFFYFIFLDYFLHFMRNMAVILNQKRALVFIVMALISPTLSYSTEEHATCKATYYGSHYCKAFPLQACGYGLYGKTINGGYVAAVSKLYKNGTGCGACYQVKCNAPACNEEGVKVVATDHAFTNDADFVVRPRVYARLAKPGKEVDLLDCEYVDVEYQRIPCYYHDKNIMVKIHEHSYYPHYLALVLLYQGGMYDITAVEIHEEASQEWKACRKSYGAMWDIHNPPKGELTVRFYACGSGTTDGKWIVASKVIPASWKPGLTLDTSVQLS